MRLFAPHDAKAVLIGIAIDYTEVISMDSAFVEGTPDAGAKDPVAELMYKTTLVGSI